LKADEEFELLNQMAMAMAMEMENENGI